MKKVLSVATFLFVAIIASASLSHTGSNGGAYFITSGCVKCGTCLDACPVGAIYDAGEQYVATIWNLTGAMMKKNQRKENIKRCTLIVHK